MVAASSARLRVMALSPSPSYLPRESGQIHWRHATACTKLSAALAAVRNENRLGADASLIAVANKPHGRGGEDTGFEPARRGSLQCIATFGWIGRTAPYQA